MRATVTTTIEAAPAHFKERAHASAVAPEVYTSSSRRIVDGTLRCRGTRKAPSTFSCRRDPGKARLGNLLPGSRKRQRVERETAASRKTGSDQRGKVEPPPEIFPGVGRYRNHGRRNTVRDQVPPSPNEGLVDAQGHNVDRVGAARVFRRYDRGANVPRVGEEGARGVERGRDGGAEAAGGRMQPGSGNEECAAPGACRSLVGGPPGDGGWRKVGGWGRQQFPEHRAMSMALRASIAHAVTCRDDSTEFARDGRIRRSRRRRGGAVR